MKRLLPMFGALLLAISPIAAEMAHADPGGRGRGRDRGEERYERRGGGERYEGRERGRGQGQGQGQGRGARSDEWQRNRDGRWSRDGGGPNVRRERDYGGRMEPDYGPPRAYGARRGAYVGPRGGAIVEDYPRHRLRAPPRGFVWMRMQDGYGMVNEDTGQVFDVIPY